MPEDDKHSPLEDVRKGLGLLLRAAKSTVESIPTKDLEDAVVTGAREVGRALENVGKTIEREVFGGKGGAPSATESKAPTPPAEAATPDAAPIPGKDDGPPAPPGGPRVG